MGTICFDIKRVDKNYVCIQHCALNKFEYEYHLPFSYYQRSDKDGHDHSWLQDKKHRYVWLIVAKEKRTGIERIINACNDKRWSNHTLKSFTKDTYFINWDRHYEDFRFIKLPFNNVQMNYSEYFKCDIPIYKEADLKDEFKLYCPIKLNKKYRVYTDHYKELKPTKGKVVKIGGDELRINSRRRFQWIPPKKVQL